jgi:hypothetical protein
MSYPQVINDPRLDGYTQRMRNGSTQTFYHGDDHRDFERYRTEGGPSNSSEIKMHDKPDTIYIEPPEKHIYAELIDGQWYWVNGCGSCNGKQRDWTTYIECDKHNVCASCGCSRSQLTEAPWGGKNGWVCKPCADIEDAARKAKALERVADYEYNEWDFYSNDEITCPHCKATIESDGDDYGCDSDDRECHDCGNTFELTAVHSVTWTTKRKDDAA